MNRWNREGMDWQGEEIKWGEERIQYKSLLWVSHDPGLSLTAAIHYHDWEFGDCGPAPCMLPQLHASTAMWPTASPKHFQHLSELLPLESVVFSFPKLNLSCPGPPPTFVFHSSSSSRYLITCKSEWDTIWWVSSCYFKCPDICCAVGNPYYIVLQRIRSLQRWAILQSG